MDNNDFRQTLAQFATGVTIIISRFHDTLHGMTVNAFTSVSLHPPLILFCADNQSDTLAAVQETERFTVSILGQHQETVSRRFAQKGPQHDLFQQLSLSWGSLGLPYLADSLAYLECTVEQLSPAGDHHIVLGRVHHLGALTHEDPLLYFRHHYQPSAACLKQD